MACFSSSALLRQLLIETQTKHETELKSWTFIMLPMKYNLSPIGCFTYVSAEFKFLAHGTEKIWSWRVSSVIVFSLSKPLVSCRFVSKSSDMGSLCIYKEKQHRNRLTYMPQGEIRNRYLYADTNRDCRAHRLQIWLQLYDNYTYKTLRHFPSPRQLERVLGNAERGDT
jgi:hypothetical protein